MTCPSVARPSLQIPLALIGLVEEQFPTRRIILNFVECAFEVDLLVPMLDRDTQITTIQIRPGVSKDRFVAGKFVWVAVMSPGQQFHT